MRYKIINERSIILAFLFLNYWYEAGYKIIK